MASRPRLLLAAMALLSSAGAVMAAAPNLGAGIRPGRAAHARLPERGGKLRQNGNAGSAEAQLLLGLMELNGVGWRSTVPKLKLAAPEPGAEQCHRRLLLAALASQRRDAPPGEAAALLQRAAALGYPAAIEDVRLGRAPLSADWAGLADKALRVDLAIYSARNGEVDCLKLLGASLRELRDPFGATVLAHAVAAGAAGSVFLIAQGQRQSRRQLWCHAADAGRAA
jgi:TPR repeat protein